MANNRLYLVDVENDERILLCKSGGNGWYLYHTPEKLNEWLDLRDALASYGNCYHADAKSVLRLEIESGTLPEGRE